MQNILTNDIRHTLNGLSEEERLRFKDSTVLITGCGGFLGYYFMNFFNQTAEELGIKKIIGLDNFMLGYPEWIKNLEKVPYFNIQKFDIIRDNIADVEGADEADYIIHMASIASPMFYRADSCSIRPANCMATPTQPMCRHPRTTTAMCVPRDRVPVMTSRNVSARRCACSSHRNSTCPSA